MGEYPWYEIVDVTTGLEQGDFIRSWPVIIPEEMIEGTGVIDTSAEERDMIIMSQSCDIQNCKIDNILVCPVMLLDEMTKYSSANDRNKIRKGEIIGYHLLNKCELPEISDGCNLPQFVDKYLIVDFRNAYSILLTFLLKGIETRREKRLRLLPPYREHLSQSFARFIMRVGLPEGIPEFA